MSENKISDGNTPEEEPNRKPYLYRNIFYRLRLRPNRSKSHHYEEDDDSEQNNDDESSTIGDDNGKNYDDVNKKKHIDIWKYFTDLTYEQGDDVLNETASKMQRVMDKYPLPELEETFDYDDDADDDDADDDDSEKATSSDEY
ncbi:uncharacterized protein LOC132733841 [Ruditapes philippinarum]|uniref:uncharacterized protein LOC132733841 n=1 Tax=Ruditapes philippinarum TaxID=129788 RepID=UPI00295BCF91|nr:uncharacterized protein LOC132733841 [Ruditapes philippinarum]